MKNTICLIFVAVLFLGTANGQLTLSTQKASLTGNDRAILDNRLSYFTAFTIDNRELTNYLSKSGGAVYLPFAFLTRKFRWKRLLCFIRAVFSPIRSSLRIAAGWEEGCAARASTVETGYFCALHGRIRAYACDVFAAEVLQTVCGWQQMYCRRESVLISALNSKNAASWRFRAPKREMNGCVANIGFSGEFYYSYLLKQQNDGF